MHVLIHIHIQGDGAQDKKQKYSAVLLKEYTVMQSICKIHNNRQWGKCINI